MNHIFEIHITVESHDLDWTHFADTCSEIGVKALSLDLAVDTHFETSSLFEGSKDDAIKEMNRIARDLSHMGYAIIREKLEVNPITFLKGHEHIIIESPFYFECHMEVDDTRLAYEQGMPVSRNKKKPGIAMLTCREDNTSLVLFQKGIKMLNNILVDQGIDVRKPEIELTIVDTNRALDDVGALHI